MLFKHHQHETRQVTAEEIPQRYRHLVVPEAKYYVADGLFGTIISQVIAEEGFSIWQHHFFIREACTLSASNEHPRIIINYMVDGQPYTKLPGKRHEALLEVGSYRLFYVPALEQTVSFLEGNYHCIHIDFDQRLLRERIKSSARLLRLLEFIIQDGTKLLPYLSGKFNEQTRTDLVDLLFYQGKDSAAYKNHIAYRLLMQYLLRHHALNGDLIGLEKYIESNLSEPLRVEWLAIFCCKSESEFYKLFKLHFSKSPHQYILDLRMKKAEELLLRTALSIKDISLLVGFTDTPSFTRAFKQRLGKSPRQFRMAILD